MKRISNRYTDRDVLQDTAELMQLFTSHDDCEVILQSLFCRPRTEHIIFESIQNVFF